METEWKDDALKNYYERERRWKQFGAEGKLKQLKDVNLDKERAFINTAWGDQEITGINRTTWWVQCGPYRSYSTTPQEWIMVEKK
jgi:hypothetical protein